MLIHKKNNMIGKIFLDWGCIEDLVYDLSKNITLYFPDIEYIHGLKRGGLIPAVMLSHLIGKPMIDSLNYPNKQILIVDDICDSGKTLQKWDNYKTAVLHYKPHTSCLKPTFWSKTHKTDEWIIYPWERDDSKTIQDYKLNLDL